jgi:protein-S-isoprenylcysteine O-methyltransferase Ste14
MSEDTTNPEVKPKISKVHSVLARSYGTYFVFLLLGLILDHFFPIRIFPSFSPAIGMVLIVLATVLIHWAQQTSLALEKKKKTGAIIGEADFHRGPYSFTRSPTHVGLNILFIGFGFLFSSPVIVITTLIPFLFARFFFLKKMEQILEEKYTILYKTYKEKVKTKL